MKRIMITGAGGQLGLALGRLFKEQQNDIIFLTGTTASLDGLIDALDITDEEAVNNYINRIQPDVIINCAAMTAVDLCESEQEKAYRINALGPKYLALAAEKLGSKLVHISSDYVYDGTATSPYTEKDETNPISVYGKTKLAGDQFVLIHCKKSFILRTAWVYGEGKNFVKTMLRLAEAGNNIRVVSDQYGCPTSAMELARVICFLIETESYGIYHAVCEGSTNWNEFARTIFKEAGIEVDVEKITTSEYPTPAKRPMYSVLVNKELHDRHGYHMKNWMDALHEYMQEQAFIINT